MCTKRSLLVVLTALAMALPAGAASAQVADPTRIVASDNVRLLGTVPNPGVIGARFRDGVMYVTSVAGLTTYDVSDPVHPAPLGVLPLPHFENEDVDLGGDILLISNDAAESTGILYVIDIADPAAPALLSVMPMGGNPLLGGPGHTASCVLDCAFAWVTDGTGIRVIDLRDPANPVNRGTFGTPAGGGIVTHDVQVDGDGLVWVAGFGGTFGYRLPAAYDGAGLGHLVARTGADGMSTYLTELGLGSGENPNDFIHHNSLRRSKSRVVYVTEEDYTRPGCRGAGSFQTWGSRKRISTAKEPVELEVLDSWTTELLADTAQPAAVCSAHYFDLQTNVIAQGWYEQGIRLLDVSNPTNIRQVGYFIQPGALAWAAYFPPTDRSGRIVYALDASHGIDVLEYDRPTAGPLSERCARQGKCEGPSPAAVEAPIFPAWRAAAPAGAPSTMFGFACRIAL
jgi:hypothetical protein